MCKEQSKNNERVFEVAKMMLPYFIRKKTEGTGRLVTNELRDAVNNAVEVAQMLVYSIFGKGGQS